MAVDVLRKIGLSPGEIKVYSALLKIGSAPINRIHESTGIERRNIYDILNKLIERGLVAYVSENKKRFFHLAHPNKIIGYIDEKKQELEKTKEEVEKEIPSLIKSFEFNRPQLNAEIFRGIEGIKSVFEDMLNHKKNYFIGGGGYIAIKTPSFWRTYNRRRLSAKTEWYNLARQELKGHYITKEKLMNTKYLPKEFSGNPTVIFIYGSKVANVLWGDDFFAFVIESKELADNYRKYFKYLWDNAAEK